jgi:hypothetical protein
MWTNMLPSICVPICYLLTAIGRVPRTADGGVGFRVPVPQHLRRRQVQVAQCVAVAMLRCSTCAP